MEPKSLLINPSPGIPARINQEIHSPGFQAIVDERFYCGAGLAQWLNIGNIAGIWNDADRNSFRVTISAAEATIAIEKIDGLELARRNFTTYKLDVINIFEVFQVQGDLQLIDVFRYGKIKQRGFCYCWLGFD